MSEVTCPCCNGEGKITVIHAPRNLSAFVTVAALAARLGYAKTTVAKQINAGLIDAEVGEIIVPYRRGGKIIRIPRPCYLIRREVADEYERKVLARRQRGQRVAAGRGVVMLEMHEQGHSDEVIAKRFGIKPASARRTYLRLKAKVGA